MSKGTEITSYLNTLILIAGAITAWLTIDEFLPDLATQSYHDQDVITKQAEYIEQLDEKLAPIQQAANAAHSNTLPPRITNLLKVRCANPAVFGEGDLQNLLDKLMEQYKALNNRTYNPGKCEDGIYYNSLGVRQ